jgi:hypothetical protein
MLNLLWSPAIIQVFSISVFLKGVVSATRTDMTAPAPDDPRVIATLLTIQAKQLANTQCRGEGQVCQETDDCYVCLPTVFLSQQN